MPTLYIIGNGFDVAHGLKTSYWDFRNYLKKYAESFLVDLERMYGFAPIDVTDWRVMHNYEIVARRDQELKATLWQDFEHDLSLADDDAMLDFSASIVNNLDLESGLMGIEDTLDDYWDKQYGFIRQLMLYVFKWAKQIRLFKAQPKKFQFKNNCQDYFITFNYTNTLEKIYNISSSRILHIHGGLPPCCYEMPILGHGDIDKIKSYKILAKSAAEKFDEASASIYNAIANYYGRTFKNANRCIVAHMDFFESLSPVDSVQIIGHSLGKVDLPYLQFIEEKIHSNSNWIAFYYDPADEDRFRNTLTSLEIGNEHLQTTPTDNFWT